VQPPKNTGTETGRDAIQSESESKIETEQAFTPSEDWINEYQKQATPKLIAGLNQYARTRALTVAAAGRKVDDYYARGLVLDALGDTWLGVVRWDPSKCSLGYHMVTTIDGRADKHRKHAEKHPHYSIGDYAARRRARPSATRPNLSASPSVSDDVTWHPLRHTFCTRLAMLGVPVVTIKELAGHASITTTMRYMHVVKGAADDAIALLDAPAVARTRHGNGEVSADSGEAGEIVTF
jgi:integrase